MVKVRWIGGDCQSRRIWGGDGGLLMTLERKSGGA
jgi:hypothetical protein